MTKSVIRNLLNQRKEVILFHALCFLTETLQKEKLIKLYRV